MTQIKLVARLNQNYHPPSRNCPWDVPGIGILLGVLGLGVLAAALYLAPQPATLGLVLLGLGLPIVLLLWHRPEFGLLALIFLTSSFVSPDSVDLRLPIGGGLDLRDLVLMGMFGLWYSADWSIRLCRYLGGLWECCCLCSWLRCYVCRYALFFQGVETNWALSDFRELSYYAVFFLTAWTSQRAANWPFSRWPVHACRHDSWRPRASAISWSGEPLAGIHVGNSLANV